MEKMMQLRLGWSHFKSFVHSCFWQMYYTHIKKDVASVLTILDRQVRVSESMTRIIRSERSKLIILVIQGEIVVSPVFTKLAADIQEFLIRQTLIKETPEWKQSLQDEGTLIANARLDSVVQEEMGWDDRKLLDVLYQLSPYQHALYAWEFLHRVQNVERKLNIPRSSFAHA